MRWVWSASRATVVASHASAPSCSRQGVPAAPYWSKYNRRDSSRQPCTIVWPSGSSARPRRSARISSTNGIPHGRTSRNGHQFSVKPTPVSGALAGDRLVLVRGAEEHGPQFVDPQLPGVTEVAEDRAAGGDQSQIGLDEEVRVVVIVIAQPGHPVRAESVGQTADRGMELLGPGHVAGGVACAHAAGRELVEPPHVLRAQTRAIEED